MSYYRRDNLRREILTKIFDGLSNKQIAGSLDLEETTVKYHMGIILKRSGCLDRHELMAKRIKELEGRSDEKSSSLYDIISSVEPIGNSTSRRCPDLN